jgi:hypothetical protein
MAAAAPQVFDVGIPTLLANATPNWDDALANFAFVLLDTLWTPDDAIATYGALDNECTDVDYAPIPVTGRTVVNGAGNACYLNSDDANFGNTVDIAARYLVCVAGDAAALVAGNPVIFYVDLNTGGTTNIASVSGQFSQSPNVNGWINIAQA